MSEFVGLYVDWIHEHPIVFALLLIAGWLLMPRVRWRC